MAQNQLLLRHPLVYSSLDNVELRYQSKPSTHLLKYIETFCIKLILSVSFQYYCGIICSIYVVEELADEKWQILPQLNLP